MKKKTYKQPVCKVHEIKMSRIYMGGNVSDVPVIDGDDDDPITVKSRNDNWEEF